MAANKSLTVEELCERQERKIVNHNNASALKTLNAAAASAEALLAKIAQAVEAAKQTANANPSQVNYAHAGDLQHVRGELEGIAIFLGVL